MRGFLGIFLINTAVAAGCAVVIAAFIGLALMSQRYMGPVGAIAVVILIIVLIGSLLEWSRKRAKK